MAIPGAETRDVEIAGKVRVGEKRGGRAASTDYFLCDHPAFEKFAGSKPKTLRIRFLESEASEAFSTGLEWWLKTRKGENLLACYTKDSGSDPIALRYEPYVDEDDKVRGEKRGHNRVPVTCRFRACPHFQKKADGKPADCRPMGRLTFVLADDPDNLVWRFETKGWESIERITKALSKLDALHTRTFELSVAFESKGNKRFPVVSITEVKDVPVEVNDDKGVSVAEATVALAESAKDKRALCDYLDVARPGWRADQRYIDRIAEVGHEQAINAILEKAQ